MNTCKIRIALAVSALLMPVLLQAQYVFTSSDAIDSLPGSAFVWPASELKETIPFGFIRVIDNRTDTTVVGFNSAKFIRMNDDKGAQYSLQKVVDEVYKNSGSKSNDTLVVVIDKLMIASNMHFQNASWGYMEDITDGLRIECRFYVPISNEYRPVYRFHYFNNPILDTKKGWAADNFHIRKDISSSWSKYLVTLFDTAFSALIKMNAQPMPDSNITIQSLSLNNNYSNLAINTTNSLKKGGYRNFNEFTNNMPGINLDDNSKLTAADTSAWGFCDGERLFIRNENTFYQIEKYDGVWYLSASINALRKKSSQANLDQVFGFTFFRLLTHPEEGKHGNKSVSPLIMMRIQNKNIMALQINYETGQPDF